MSEKNKVSKPLVLVAEDDSIGFLVISNILRKAGFEVLRAVNGAEAVELCKQRLDIQLVLMDINMPVMDGLEATRIIRSFRHDLPVIAVTAYTADNTRNVALEAGCDDYIPKPVDKSLVIEKIKELIHK